jgi:hypothetical protein
MGSLTLGEKKHPKFVGSREMHPTHTDGKMPKRSQQQKENFAKLQCIYRTTLRRLVGLIRHSTLRVLLYVSGPKRIRSSSGHGIDWRTGVTSELQWTASTLGHTQRQASVVPWGRDSWGTQGVCEQFILLPTALSLAIARCGFQNKRMVEKRRHLNHKRPGTLRMLGQNNTSHTRGNAGFYSTSQEALAAPCGNRGNDEYIIDLAGHEKQR